VATRQDAHPVDPLFAGAGEARAAAAAVDWSATPLGPVERWPEPLRTAVRLCLASRTTMAVWAGPELTLAYNDGYVPVLGPAKHPWAMGRPLREVWPEVLEQIAPDFRRVVEDGASTRLEEVPYRLLRGGRPELAFFTYTLTPIRGEDGRILGVFNVMEELTGTVRARNRTAELLAFALDTASLGAWELDLAAGTAQRSVQHDRIFGYEELQPEWTYARFLEHVLPEDRAEVDRKYRGAVAARQDWTFECRIRRRDGEVRWIWAAGRHRLDDRGEATTIAGIVQDITDRKRAEEELRQSRTRLEQERARLQAIVDTIPVGFFIADADGRVITANDEATRIWAGAVPLRSVVEYGEYVGHWPDTGERVKAEEWPLAQALLHGRKMKAVVADIERFDGTKGTIVMSGSPVKDERGRTTGAVAALQDISDLRAAQARLEEAATRSRP
jgi:PAS domain S-box-containing protein